MHIRMIHRMGEAVDKLIYHGRAPCLHEVTAAIALVQNALANSSPEIKDNTLNSTEKKIVARAVLAEIVSNFNYEPEDLR